MARSCVGDASSFVCSAARTFTAVAVRRCEMALIVVHVWKGQRTFSLAAFERGGASTEVMVVVLAPRSKVRGGGGTEQSPRDAHTSGVPAEQQEQKQQQQLKQEQLKQQQQQQQQEQQ
ncbi:unnamed protein product [Lampetra planeri]